MSETDATGFTKVTRKKRRKVTDSPTSELKHGNSDDGMETASEVTLSSDCESDSQTSSGGTVKSSVSVGKIRNSVALRKQNKLLLRQLRKAREDNRQLLTVIKSLEATIAQAFGTPSPPLAPIGEVMDTTVYTEEVKSSRISSQFLDNT